MTNTTPRKSITAKRGYFHPGDAYETGFQIQAGDSVTLLSLDDRTDSAHLRVVVTVSDFDGNYLTVNLPADIFNL